MVTWQLCSWHGCAKKAGAAVPGAARRLRAGGETARARASIELLRELLGLAQTTRGKNILSWLYSRLTSFPLKIFACARGGEGGRRRRCTWGGKQRRSVLWRSGAGAVSLSTHTHHEGAPRPQRVHHHGERGEDELRLDVLVHVVQTRH